MRSWSQNLATVLCAFAFALTAGCKTTAIETARGSWFAVTTPRFSVWTDADPEQARALVASLERFRQVLLATTTAEERDEPLPLGIFLAKDQASFASLLGSNRLAGVFIATLRGNYALVDARRSGEATKSAVDGQTTLFHEYSHYVQALVGAALPSWYNEGFAEYMSTTEFHADGSYTVGCPPVYRTRRFSDAGWAPLRDVFDADSIEELSDKLDADTYLQAWYVFHYFTSVQSRQRQLQEYLRLWRERVETNAAIKQAFGLDSAQLNREIRDYAAKGRVGCLSVQPKQPLRTPEVQVRPLSEAEAHYRVGDLLLNLFGPQAAVFTLLQHAVESGGVPEAQFSLARAQAAKTSDPDGVYTEAGMQLAERTLKGAQRRLPDDASGLTLEGDLLMQRLVRMPSDAAGRAERLAAARKAYRRAIRRDETFAEAYYKLGMTYLGADNGSKEPEVALEAAAFLLPLSTDVAWALARLHLQRHEPLEARPALEFVVRNATNHKLIEKAKAQLLRVRSQASEARAPGG